MQTYFSPLGKRSRAALAGVAAVTCVSLLSSVLLLFETKSVAWAGLEARLQQPEPPCPTTGKLPEGCKSAFASAKPAGKRSG